MSKITRQTAQIFGKNAGSDQIAEFGSLAAGTPTFSTALATIQSGTYSAWLSGWFDAVIGANSPAIEDMNAFCYVMAYQIAYLMQAGIAEYDSSTIYYTGSLCMSAGKIYVSLTDANTGNALTNGTYWALQGNSIRAITSGTTDTATSTDNKITISVGSTAFTETLPAISGLAVGFIISVKNLGTGLVTVSGNGGDTIDGSSTYPLRNQYDSANFVVEASGTWGVW